MKTRRRFPWQGVVFFVCLVILAGVGLWLGTMFFQAPSPVVAPPADMSPRARRFLDGVWVDPADAVLPTIGVIVENFIDARPPSGIARAQLVYEAPAEAGITRFLAFYGVPDAGAEIGPVRSLRPYFLDWAKEIGAAIVHVGGSPEAMARVRREYSQFDIDQFFESGSFWRTKERAAPHNVYTTLPLLRDVLKARNVIPPGSTATWTFVDDTPLDARPSNQQIIELAFSTDPYTVRWEYDRAANVYHRFHGATMHRDTDGTFIRAKNIVVIPTTVKILDQVGRRSITLSGSGPARVFRDGLTIDARWERKTVTDRIRFVDARGDPIPLTAGATWVEIFPRTGKMIYNGKVEKLEN